MYKLKHNWYKRTKGKRGGVVTKEISFKVKKFKLKNGKNFYNSKYIEVRQFKNSAIVVLKVGYQWNGASRPAIQTKNTFRASALHDALYQLHRLSIVSLKYRKQFDKEYYYVLREEKMCYVRAKGHYIAVRVGGKSHASPEKHK